jgi:glycine/D-amino acid oxidase-like deaminating enzyme
VIPERRLKMRVGILGGGLQGCCIALALAESGVQVTVYDRNPQLLSRTAVANEGKIHLGYMYAGDPSLKTARTMLTGALSFLPFMTKHLDLPAGQFETSRPAVYLVHRDSQQCWERVADYFDRVHGLILERADTNGRPYFGFDLRQAPRTWSKSERDSEFNDKESTAAFDTPEVAIDPVHLAQLLRERIADTPNIQVRLDENVRSVETGNRLRVHSEGQGAPASEQFDHVVNALWEGRLAIDATLGHRPRRPWIHRLKYGVSFRPPAGAARPPSATVVLGPFGEVVDYPNGAIYITWYPECVLDRTDEVAPPEWATYPGEPLHSQIFVNKIGRAHV